MQIIPKYLYFFKIALEKNSEIEYNSIVLFYYSITGKRNKAYLFYSVYPTYKKGTSYMAVDLKTIQHLCELSKLNYDEAGLEKVMGEMSDIIDLMDTIKSFDLTYDDTKDNNSISLSEVREDIAQPSFPTEKLLSNAENSGSCYVVPKVVE